MNGSITRVDGAWTPAPPARRYMLRTYRRAATVFHWTTAALVLVQVVLGVTMKQLGDGPAADLLFTLHKTGGILILVLVVARLLYRLLRLEPGWRGQPYRRPVVHATLYAMVILVPLVGWAALSDFGARTLFDGWTLPAIWPEGAGYADLLFGLHAYLAFGLLALVALHIGIAMQDHMMYGRNDAPEAE